MKSIDVKDLNKNYLAKVKKPGMAGSLRALLKPEYKNIEALQGVSFSLDRGQALGFIGANGSGKSTTIKILSGILHPTSGHVRVAGLDPARNRRKLAYKIGSVFGQRSQLWLHLPAYDSFMLLASIYNVPEAAAKERIRELTKTLHLDEVLYMPVRKLSLGQRMKCELAASLLHRPEILLLDEPSIGLDVLAKQTLRTLVKGLVDLEGISLILTSHDMTDIESVCSEVLLINSGRIAYTGSLPKLKAQFARHRELVVQYSTDIDITTLSSPVGLNLRLLAPSRVACRFALGEFSMDSILSKLTRLGEIHDLMVKEESLEDVVGQIYSESRTAAK